jgi:hypothetical protein
MRDGYRCMITGCVDYATVHAYPNEFVALSTIHGIRPTSCAHIFAPSTSRGILGDNADGPKVTLVEVVMIEFGPKTYYA